MDEVGEGIKAGGIKLGRKRERGKERMGGIIILNIVC